MTYANSQCKDKQTLKKRDTDHGIDIDRRVLYEAAQSVNMTVRCRDMKRREASGNAGRVGLRPMLEKEGK